MDGNVYGVHDEVGVVKCDFIKLNAAGEGTRVACVDTGYAWLTILGHGTAKAESVPESCKDFFDGLLRKTAISYPAERPPSRYKRIELGGVVWEKANPLQNGYQLFSRDIATTTENSNWIGNIYFANYSEWMSHVRDLYFHTLTPDSFRNSGRDGEWVCLSCSIDHLTEAMPFDTIRVTMDVGAIYQRGLDLIFDYYLLENDGISRKLAHGTHRMAWVGRNSGDQPIALDLPQNVTEKLLQYALSRV